MERIAVDALVLRARLPELTLRPGSSVVARVAARAEAHGVLVLAGVPLTARLPDEVSAGDTLRLTVAEVTHERITLRIEPEAAAHPPVPAPAAPRAHVSVGERPRRTGATQEDDAASVALTFHSPALGALELQVELVGGAAQVRVTAGRGVAYALAEESARELREALERHVGPGARVTVQARREPVDLYG